MAKTRKKPQRSRPVRGRKVVTKKAKKRTGKKAKRRKIRSKPKRLSLNFTSAAHIRSVPPKPSAAFATYWRFAKARQDLYFAQLYGQNYPASSDPILSRHRFTNVYRASDRVSQYLIRHVIYDGDWRDSDFLFRVLLFKFFNKIEMWEALEAELGEITWKGYDFQKYDDVLSRISSTGKTIYSAAYIMPSGRSAFGSPRKHRNHLKIIAMMVEALKVQELASKPSLGSIFKTLRSFPSVGPFIGYQLAIDLNYGPQFNFSENDCVEAGPGALDGISKCFSSVGDYSPADIIRYMTDIQEQALKDYAPGFKSLWGRRLHLIDCQNLFCEVSKYSRVAHPEIPGIAKRTRIKQLYRPSLRQLERPWFPPKWGINDAIDKDSQLKF